MRSVMRQRRGKIGRRGVMLALIVVMMVMIAAIASLAVDYGHVQLIKSEMQRTADSAARGYMQYYITNGQAYANSHGPALYGSANNPVDGNSGVSPTVTVTWGFWTVQPGFFNIYNGTYPAVMVTVTRTSSGGNGVPLFWGGMMGFLSADVHATAIAAEMGGQTSKLTIPSTASLYVAGMPSGSSTFGGDNTSNAAAYQVTAIPVVPGTWISFANLAGTTTVSPGSLAYVGPAGNPQHAVHHGQSWNSNPNNPGPENGVADAVMYEDATAGLFLGNNAPYLTAAPAAVDWTQASQKNQASYSNIAVKQPFMIGTGTTPYGAPQKFLVPPGATRLYVGIWDGYQYYNNGGTLTGTVTATNYVQLVQ